MLQLKVVEAVECAIPPPNPSDPRVSIWRDLDGSISAYCYRTGAYYCLDLPAFGRFRFGTPDEILAVLAPNANRRNLEDTYRRHVLPLALKALGYSVLHASAVVTSNGVVALCGSAHTGKSTFAHALSLRGYTLWADDAVAFQPGEAGVETIAIPFRIRLRREAAAFFSAIGGATPVNGTNLDLEMLPRMPLASVAMLRRVTATDSPTTGKVRRLCGPEALIQLLPQAYSLDPTDVQERRRLFEDYMLVAGSVRMFEFQFRPGFEYLDAAVDGLERELLRKPK